MYYIDDIEDVKTYFAYSICTEEERKEFRETVMQMHNINLKEDRPDLYMFTARRIIAMMQYDIDRAEAQIKGKSF